MGKQKCGQRKQKAGKTLNETRPFGNLHQPAPQRHDSGKSDQKGYGIRST